MMNANRDEATAEIVDAHFFETAILRIIPPDRILILYFKGFFFVAEGKLR